MGLSLSSLDPTSSKSVFGGGARFVEALEGLGGFVEGGLLGGDAADAARAASAEQASYQQQGLDYLMETEAIPQELRQASLQSLGGLYGIPGFEQYGNQQQMIEQAQASPFYQAGIDTGTEAIARTANVTGGLRGGGGAADIAGFESNLLNQAYQQQLQGIQGLAQLPSAAPQISQQYGNIGQTYAQGITGAAQSQQDALGQLLGFGGQAGTDFIASDRRLKTDIEKIGTTSNPYIDKYKWTWAPNDLGKEGKEIGYIAQEVEAVYPDLVVMGEDGYRRINKGKLEARLKELN